MNREILHCDDCLPILKHTETASVDLFYIDPPFFTQKKHTLSTRDGSRSYSFKDIWSSFDHYGEFILERVRECFRCLKPTGSMFFHCDRNAGHIARLIMDEVFGAEQFRSEIIWSFRRWSNSQERLMPSHQTILFYAKSPGSKFNITRIPYSESTNIDQILQKRVRDSRGKAVYERDAQGVPVSNGAKQGVPLGDVWDIPYLNPKAKERAGYPTQKPILLLERIIELCTDEDDLVIDPFCGSGTTLVAAKRLNRRSIGIDCAEAAVNLARHRLATLVKTESRLLESGRESYLRPDTEILEILKGIDFHPVHRNHGMDAILARECQGKPVCIRIQRQGESIEQAASQLSKAAANKGGAKLFLIVIEPEWIQPPSRELLAEISLIYSPSAAITKALNQLEVSDSMTQSAGIDGYLSLRTSA